MRRLALDLRHGPTGVRLIARSVIVSVFVMGFALGAEVAALAVLALLGGAR